MCKENAFDDVQTEIQTHLKVSHTRHACTWHGDGRAQFLKT